MTTKPQNRIEFEAVYGDRPSTFDTLEAYRAVVYKDGTVLDMHECDSIEYLARFLTRTYRRQITASLVTKKVNAHIAHRDLGFDEDWKPLAGANAWDLG